jgi:hypothetical protein
MQRLVALHRRNKKEILFTSGCVYFGAYSGGRFFFVLLLLLLLSSSLLSEFARD